MAYTRAELEDALQAAHAAGDRDAAERIAAELQGAMALDATPRAKAAAPAGAAGAPDAGGSSQRPIENKYARAAISAIPRGVAGVVDLGIAGGEKADKMLGLLEPNFEGPRFSPHFDLVRPEERNLGTEAISGGLMGPLAGGRFLPSLAAGAGGGAAAEAASEAGLPWWAQLGAGLAGGGVAGSLAAAPSTRLSEVLAQGRLRRATEGLTPAQLRQGQGAMTEAGEAGINLAPSQSVAQPAGGLERLQAELLKSRASGADALRERVGAIPIRMREMVERLRNSGGQTPRDDVLLAEDVQKLAGAVKGDRGRAVNAATEADYAAGSRTGIPTFGARSVPQAEKLFDDAIKANRADSAIVGALTDAKKELTGLLKQGRVTPEEVVDLVSNLKRDLPARTAMNTPSAESRVRGVVSEVLDKVRTEAEKIAPSLQRARETQADLRSVLPGKFDEFERVLKAGSPEAALNLSSKQSMIAAELGKRSPQLGQELLQRQVNQAVEKALGTDVATGRSRPNAGAITSAALTEGAAGEALQKNLALLFRGAADPQAAAEGFNRVLRAVNAASRSTGAAGSGPGQGVVEEAARLGGGTYAQRINVLGRLGGNALGRFRDNATISVLTRPDVMERLAYLASLPPTQITSATLLATVPELFKEQK